MTQTLTFRLDGGELALAADEEVVPEKCENLEGAALTECLEEYALENDEGANPILPTGPELFWGAVLFMLLWARMKWVLLPPVEKTQAKRADQVRSDRDAAEKALTEAKLQADQVRGLLDRVPEPARGLRR